MEKLNETACEKIEIQNQLRNYCLKDLKLLQVFLRCILNAF